MLVAIIAVSQIAQPITILLAVLRMLCGVNLHVRSRCRDYTFDIPAKFGQHCRHAGGIVFAIKPHLDTWNWRLERFKNTGLTFWHIPSSDCLSHFSDVNHRPSNESEPIDILISYNPYEHEEDSLNVPFIIIEIYGALIAMRDSKASRLDDLRRTFDWLI
ncbi:hypothetical protein GJ496_002090 [Pomphorhynchus laevis]|nr:hypothetical protein GJ496_002090 [Pomphorhynchus laevis]